MSDCANHANLSPSYRALYDQLDLWAKENKRPLSATLELTPYCNLRCPMCYVRLDPLSAAKQGKLMSGEQWLEILREAAELGLMMPSFTGGEPLLHPQFWEIYNGATELGMFPSIFTNGCLIDEAAVERFKANPPLEIKISIYGASNETYERMCGDKHGFDKLAHAIDLLKEAGINFYCTSTIVKQNIHDLAAMYEFTMKRGVRMFHSVAVTGSVRTELADAEGSRIHEREMNWTLENIKPYIGSAEVLPPFDYCGNYQKSFFLTWHGHLQFCVYSPTPYVQLGNGTRFSDAWAELLERCEREVHTPEECRTCKYRRFCMRCPGLLASESGDPSRVSPSFCRRAKEVYEAFVRLRAEAEKNAEGEQKTDATT